MRPFEPGSLKSGEIDMAAIELDPNSRDDIPALLRGLQYL